ncbi:unnamed protein product, partial [Symbiodinium sp. KB8]
LLVFMPSLKADFNIVSFNAAITGCERGSSWELATAMLQEAFQYDPNAVIDPACSLQASCGAVIAACRRAAKWQSAVHLLHVMRGRFIEPDLECRRVVELALVEASCSRLACSLKQADEAALVE